MRCRVLGPALVGDDGSAHAVKGQSATVLAHLVAAHPGAVAVDLLADALWGDDRPPSARTGLQVVMAKLRRLLGADSIVHDADAATYRLTIPAHDIDAHAYLVAVTEAEASRRHGDAGAALAVLDAVRGWWRGPALGSTVFESLDFVQQLHDARARADDLTIELLLDAGEVERAVGEAEAACVRAPLREHRWCLLMTALYRDGRAADALRAAQRYRAMLADELGLEPGPALVATEAAVLDHDPVLLGRGHGADRGPRRAWVITAPSGRPPAITTSFVGRAAECAQLAEARQRHRIVTVVGPAGVGKTRLVVETCASVSDRRVVWIDLSVETAATVAAAVAAHLGVRGGGGLSSSAELLTLDDKTLAVLDNAEHALAEVGAVAETLVAASPDLDVVVTSRSPLGTPSERVLTLAPLEADAAVALLADRTDLGRNLPDDAARALVERVDGLPLAIELLAPRLRTATVHELMAELDDPRPVPLQVTEGVSARVASSVAALGDAERSLFRALGVMAGSFSAGDAAGVSGCPAAEIRPLLDTLVVRSLLAADLGGREPRYRLLAAFREHGRTLARAEGSLDAHRQAHAAHFAAAAVWHGERMRTRQEATAADALDAMADQLREAWSWCRANDDHDRAGALVEWTWEWSLGGLHDRHYGWAPELAASPGLEGHPRRRTVLAVASLAEWARDRRDDARRFGEAALAEAERTHMPSPGFAHQGLFNVHAYEGRYDDAVHHLLASLARAEEDGSEFLQVGAHVTFSLGYAQMGATDLAEQSATRAFDLAERIGNPSCQAFALHALASVRLMAEPAAAVAQFEEAATLAESVRNRWVTGVALAGLATALRRAGEVPQAAAVLATLLPHWFRVAMTAQLGHSLQEAALVFDQLGYEDAARRALAHVPESGHLHPQLTDDADAVRRLRGLLGVVPAEAPDLAEVVPGLVAALAAGGTGR